MIVYWLFLPAHYCYYSGLTVLNKDFIHSFILYLMAIDYQSMWAECERPIRRSALKPIFMTPAQVHF